MINTEKLMSIYRSEEDRPFMRGLSSIICDFIDAKQQISPITSLCELGVSGGGSIDRWARATSSDTIVSGVERFHPDLDPVEYGDLIFDEDLARYKDALHILNPWDNVKVLFGADAYSDVTTVKLTKLLEVDKLDLLVDDAATDWPDMQYSLPVWRDSIAENGLFMSLTPDGQGVDTFWNMSRDQHMLNFKILARYGMVVFDMEDHKPYEDVYPWNAHFIGFYAADWEPYREVIEKYRNNIVAGEGNISFLGE